MKKNLAIIGTAICFCAVVVGMNIIAERSDPLKKARKQWKENAIAQIAKQTSNSADILKEIEAMKLTPPGTEWWDTWLSQSLIVMTNGEWMAYRNVCYKEEGKIPDLFLGRGSDGRWYYSTYHFCVNMQNLDEEAKMAPGVPRSLTDFSNRYCVQEFDGRSDECLKDTKHLWDRRQEAILGRRDR